MKEIVVLSGKGGTGKTSIVGSFASLAKNKVLVDCDVDAADLHLLLQPDVQQQQDFWSGQYATIDKGKCDCCGLCEQMCRFKAIRESVINPISCDGCGFCSHICPVQAISMENNLAGRWFISDTRYGPLVHARLGIAQENSGKLVAQVRKKAKDIAVNLGADYIICDGPPGIGCPVISSLSGADLALLITEPTLSGKNDLERITGVCNHFGVPATVCINKYDISEENSLGIEEYCKSNEIPVVAKIHFDNVVTEAMIKGLPVVEYKRNKVSEQLVNLWKTVTQYIPEDERVKYGQI